ncbi:endonuclease/exonuclease/phosphatase family protein [Planococcus sp. APC 4015]|nr:endonuclease/exonuclease/phosphatase family protein [Planococcus sp. APC 4015]
MRGALLGPAAPPDLHVMTVNVRRRLERLALRRADRWSERAPRLHALLASERPTIVGAQEALPEQTEVIADALGSSHRFIGRGRRADGGGESCPLFYDTTRLDLLEWEQTALSDRPDVAGSRTWGNPLPRVLVRARFRDRLTDAQLVVFNTHLDPFSARSRLRSADSIRRMIAGLPVATVLIGDLNAAGDSPAVRALCEDGNLRDAWAAAQTRATPEWATFGNYRPPRLGERIDWMLVSPDVTVTRAAINARRYLGGWPSDHLAVQATLRVAP